MTDFTHYNNIINIQNRKYFPYCLVGHNIQCQEIVFSDHQNAENDHNETLIKKGQKGLIPLKFGLGTLVLLHDCSNHHSKT